MKLVMNLSHPQCINVKATDGLLPQVARTSTVMIVSDLVIPEYFVPSTRKATPPTPTPPPPPHTHMMSSSNGNIFCVTGPLWGEFTSHRWIPLTKASAFMFSVICAWTNGWANHRDAGDWKSYDLPLCLLWHHCNGNHQNTKLAFPPEILHSTTCKSIIGFVGIAYSWFYKFHCSSKSRIWLYKDLLKPWEWLHYKMFKILLDFEITQCLILVDILGSDSNLQLVVSHFPMGLYESLCTVKGWGSLIISLTKIKHFCLWNKLAIFFQMLFPNYHSGLTHWSLLSPCDIIDLSQHPFR